MTASTSEDSAWRARLAPYKKASWGPALGQLLATLLPFTLLWTLMLLSLRGPYLWTLALAVPTAFFFVRLFIIQHDCGHGSFFPSRRANNLLGAVLGVVTLFPYGYWRRTHAIHHANVGNLDERELGDIHTLTVAEYRALPAWRRLAYRAYRHPLVLFGIGPAYQFLVKHRFPWDIPFAWKREWRSVLGTNAALLAVFAIAMATIGGTALLAVHLPVVLLAGTLGVWLFYVQHQFEETYWDREDSWDYYRAGVHGSSFYDLPPLLHWLTGNIGYHHIHHLASQIPSYRLPDAFRDLPEMQRVTRLSLRESFRCTRLKLWCEERRALVGFRDLAAPARAAAADA